MDVTTSRNELVAGLKDAARGVARASALPVLHNFHLQAKQEPSRLTIRSTVLEIGVTEEVPAQVQAAGETLEQMSMFEEVA